MAQAIIEIDSSAGAGAALVPILGRSALQRHIHALRRHGVDAIHIRDVQDDGRALDPWLAAASRQIEQWPGACSRSGLIPWNPGAHSADGPIIVVRGDAVYDARLYAELSAAPGPLQLTDGGRPIGLAKLNVAAHTPAAGSSLLADPLTGGPAAPRRELGELPRSIAALRRHLTPYWTPVASATDRSQAKRLILDAAQKGVLDFPARFLHPWPENRLAEWAANRRLTPNQITIVSAVIGFVATYLFAVQAFGAALGCAVLAGILDGVDGKLARIKLLSSPFGDRLDHTLDVSFEFSWYIALGWGLTAAGADHALVTGFAILALMIAARALSGVYLALTGYQIHDHTTFDRAVRLIAGRRNIYVVILVIGYFAGALAGAFELVLWWAAATVGVYAARIGVALVTRGRRTRAASDGLAHHPTDL